MDDFHNDGSLPRGGPAHLHLGFEETKPSATGSLRLREYVGPPLAANHLHNAHLRSRVVIVVRVVIVIVIVIVIVRVVIVC